ncbi:MAG: hypothetical protein HY782_15410 [Chloroflexi bacterium]|nr:hypothetical protein [Chloroflexota bacterium]
MEEHLELWLSFLACLVLAAFYGVYALLAAPSGGHPFGLSLGAIGMALMLITETIYSIRKRVRWLHWLGSLRLWLSFHILTGIVGPFLVLLHSGFAVGGVAGWALTMAGMVVLSGFVGRYIYTAVPRTRAGIEWSRDELAVRADQAQMELDEWVAQAPAVEHTLARLAGPPANASGWRRVLLRGFEDSTYTSRVRAALRPLKHAERARLGELQRLLRQQRQLERQIASLDSAQRLMGVWRLVHIPLGIALFATAFIHVIAALYFKGLPF